MNFFEKYLFFTVFYCFLRISYFDDFVSNFAFWEVQGGNLGVFVLIFCTLFPLALVMFAPPQKNRALTRALEH